jgi:hypothetical protein
MSSEPVLCYIEGCWAYFTTQPLDKQWGDDWDDAPYEHNAGTPYEWHEFDGLGCVCLGNGGPRYYGPTGCSEEGHEPVQPRERWTITRVAFDDVMDTPREGVLNSSWSVQQINRGDVAWLRPCRWEENEAAQPIMAGTTLSEFKRLLALCGGKVYVAEEGA